KTRPYVFLVQNDYPVNMVRHYHEGIQRYAMIMAYQVIPGSLHHFPKLVQPHFPAHDLSE
ncbi:MAG: hypothetical protein BZY88_00005, partial [SAR202 cluster bacterium Io17-Chloro-G9]